MTHEEMKKRIAESFTVSPTSSDTRPIVEALIEWAFDANESMTNVLERNLESISCAGGHAPGGLIYANEIAAKFADWWDDIDDSLESYRDVTGEKFAPETCGQLVWFAVEWFAHEVAAFMRAEIEGAE